jgi:hypothetical protein
MATSQASCEAIWLHKLLVGLFGQELSSTVIHCDNHSRIKLSENPVLYQTVTIIVVSNSLRIQCIKVLSKHIEIRYPFIRDWAQRGAVKLQYISNDQQVEDILTKAFPRGKHVYFRDKMGLVRNTFLGKRECSVLVYQGKWSPCGCGSLATRGKYLTHCALYFV